MWPSPATRTPPPATVRPGRSAAALRASAGAGPRPATGREQPTCILRACLALDRKILTTATPAATAATRSSETGHAAACGGRETLDVGERVGPGGAGGAVLGQFG